MFYLLLVFCILFVVCLAIVVYIIAKAATVEYEDDIHSLIAAGTREVNLIRIAYYARTLYFLNQNYYTAQSATPSQQQIDLSELESISRSVLKTDAVAIEDEQNEFESRSPLLTSLQND